MKKIAFTILTALFLFATFQLQAKSFEKFPAKLKTSLNAYSFNVPLSKGEINLDDLLEFCAENQFDAVDLTG